MNIGVEVVDGVIETIGIFSIGVSTVALLLQARSKNKTQNSDVILFKMKAPKFIAPQQVDRIPNTTCHWLGVSPPFQE